MPRQTSSSYDPDSDTYKQTHIGAEKDSGELKDSLATAKRATTAGAGLGSLAKKAVGAPKMQPGEDLDSFRERMRKYREEQAKTMAGGESAVRGR